MTTYKLHIKTVNGTEFDTTIGAWSVSDLWKQIRVEFPDMLSFQVIA